MKRWLMLLLVTAVVGLTSAPSTAQEIAHRQVVLYSAPMLTAVIDPFRPPARIGAPGNRGLEYGSSDNQVVGGRSRWVRAFRRSGCRPQGDLDHA